MREYYARFFREVRRQVFIFWKAQIAVSISAGFIAAVTNAIREQTPFAVAAWSVGIAVIGYLVVLGLASIGAAMRAPVNLDQQRVDEIRRQGEDSEQQIAYHREDSRQQYIGRVKAEAALEQERIRKHPHDDHKEKVVIAWLGKLDDHEKEFIKWLLTVPRAGNPVVQGAGFHGVPSAVIAKTGHLVSWQIERSGNGMEIDRHFSINPEFVQTLKDILYPPRPVTPPPA